MFFGFVILYIFFFSFSVISGLFFWMKTKGSRLLALYELLAGIYTIFILFIYIEPSYKKFLGIPNVIPIIAIILLDFYFTVFADIRAVIPELPKDWDAEEVEAARVASSLFSAPAYIMSALVAVDIIKQEILS